MNFVARRPSPGLAAFTLLAAACHSEDHVCSMVVSDLHVIGSAIERHAKDHAGALPSSLESLVAARDSMGLAYLGTDATTPKDPWKRPYRYVHQDAGSWYCVFTLGSDDAPGGTGDAADVVFSNVR